eukprot:SAG31_NODE_1626_length_7710_cov_28.409933_7_plen_384_part_00
MIELLSAEPPNSYSLRLFSFLSRLPNFGVGAMKSQLERTAGRRAKHQAADSASADVYARIGNQCAEHGVCVDLYVIAHHDAGLTSLRSLTTLSGGALLLYEPVAKEGWANLPQDVSRELSRQRAVQGLLRLRTSPDFRVAHAFGHLSPDSEYENLYRVVGCDPHSTFAFDFEFNDTTSFEQADASPRVQMAFCYCRRKPGSGSPQKRIRIDTQAMHLAQNAPALYQCVNADVVMTLMTHKIALAADEEGIVEGANLLKDWFRRLLAAYRGHMSLDSTVPMHLTFQSAGAGLQTLPRYIFGLLKSPLLRSEGVSLDSRVFIQVRQPAVVLLCCIPVLPSVPSQWHAHVIRPTISRVFVCAEFVESTGTTRAAARCLSDHDSEYS